MAGAPREEPSPAVRGLRLFTLGATAPAATLVVVHLVSILHFRGRPGLSSMPLVYASPGVLVALIAAWSMYWKYRDKPQDWVRTVLSGIFSALLAAAVIFGTPEELRFGLGTITFTVLGLTIVLGILVLSWLPTLRGERLILRDLPAVVDSSLVIEFRSRVDGGDLLHVTPDSLHLVLRGAKSTGKGERSYPLVDVTAITIRPEKSQYTYPVPGIPGRTIRTGPGQVVVITVRGGKLVFPVKDVRQLAHFIAERRAVAIAG